MWEYNYNELYHYGIKGMKWYQNIFGNRPGPETPSNIGKVRNIFNSQSISRAKHFVFSNESRHIDAFTGEQKITRTTKSILDLLKRNPGMTTIQTYGKPTIINPIKRKPFAITSITTHTDPFTGKQQMIERTRNLSDIIGKIPREEIIRRTGFLKYK